MAGGGLPGSGPISPDFFNFPGPIFIDFLSIQIDPDKSHHRTSPYITVEIQGNTAISCNFHAISMQFPCNSMQFYAILHATHILCNSINSMQFPVFYAISMQFPSISMQFYAILCNSACNPYCLRGPSDLHLHLHLHQLCRDSSR